MAGLMNYYEMYVPSSVVSCHSKFVIFSDILVTVIICQTVHERCTAVRHSAIINRKILA